MSLASYRRDGKGLHLQIFQFQIQGCWKMARNETYFVLEFKVWNKRNWELELTMTHHLWLFIWGHPIFEMIILKLINYSWGQQSISEPWYPMNTQMKILWVLISDKHLHFDEHFSIINTSLTTIPKMTWILFDIINLDCVEYHRLFHKRSSVDISPPNSWPPPSQTC